MSGKYQAPTLNEADLLATDEESSAVSATRPWEGQENPWARDKFKLKKIRKGFRAKFTALHKVEDRKFEGWVIAKGKQYGEELGEITRPGLILMELPENLAKLRDEHFSNLTTKRAIDARKVQLDAQLKKQTDLKE